MEQCCADMFSRLPGLIFFPAITNFYRVCKCLGYWCHTWIKINEARIGKGRSLIFKLYVLEIMPFL